MGSLKSVFSLRVKFSTKSTRGKVRGLNLLHKKDPDQEMGLLIVQFGLILAVFI